MDLIIEEGSFRVIDGGARRGQGEYQACGFAWNKSSDKPACVSQTRMSLKLDENEALMFLASNALVSCGRHGRA
jgi:hypothetical protein